jgi:antibiotic biosynthesis monooxygenase (ABM) superfamily enzyme
MRLLGLLAMRASASHGGYDCHIHEGRSMNDTRGVTKIIDRIPRAGMDAELEQAIKALNAAAMRFPGHLGVTVTRPSLPDQPGFRLVYRFDTGEHLRAWEESEEHHRLVEIASGYTQGEPSRQVLTGLETWFTLPARPAALLPQRGRMSVVTWLGIFPLVLLYDLILRQLLPVDTPVALKIAVNTSLVVPTMSYLVGPRLTRLFRDWLYPGID